MITQIIILFILWTIFGSFWSVLLTRLGESTSSKTWKWILFGFSHCPNCKSRLKAKNLVPIVSYILQHGKCAYCHKTIPKLYPSLEILSGLIFVISYIMGTHYGLNISNLIFITTINWLFLLILIYDFETYELHVPIRTWAIWITLLSQILFWIWNIKWAIIGSLIWWIFFALIYLWAKLYAKKYKNMEEGMWEWDVWMAFLIWSLIPIIVNINWLSSSLITTIELLILFLLISSILGIIYYIIRRSKNIIPFLPFMIFAFWILLFWAKYFIKVINI